MKHPKVDKAYNAMKKLGIAPEIVKPILKKLLQLYDKNWEFIEGENYRALVDAIFEYNEKKQDKVRLFCDSFWFGTLDYLSCKISDLCFLTEG